ncbi:hypothetical protein GF322_03180 [Candidatus Dependentiae bacterium]|nr:hypothetical protein [Candidatus Dependentiae bacterium]
MKKLILFLAMYLFTLNLNAFFLSTIENKSKKHLVLNCYNCYVQIIQPNTNTEICLSIINCTLTVGELIFNIYTSKTKIYFTAMHQKALNDALTETIIDEQESVNLIIDKNCNLNINKNTTYPQYRNNSDLAYTTDFLEPNNE